MADRGEFSRRFAAALAQACAERRVTQKQLGEQIAAREHQSRRPGLRREEAVARARERWPRRLSAWKKGVGHPATFNELRFALDVIAPDAPRAEWEQWWRQARDGASAVDAQSCLAGPVRLGHLAQVAQFAPPALLGRENELAELTEFCLTDDVAAGSGQYWYWKGESWAGKSALLSTFVLYPSEPLRARVRIVSFLITTRQASRDTRDAFTRVLTEQLAEITDRPLPQLEMNREDRLLELLDQAAHACQAAGKRLVLVVDGLDEDRGASTGPDGRSIAGLLPARPPAGMRIILAGRPNPPTPGDVERWHPIRDDSIVRPLSASPYAGELRERAEWELRRLLCGKKLEQDLLGLLTAARGGLSVHDLHALTEQDADSSIWEIEDILHSVAGRTFLRQASTWRPDNCPDTYLLGHDKLREVASRYLDGRRMSAYRDRLHDWADTYQAKGWPAGTPEYLLSDYYGLLIEVEDLPRIVTQSTNAARHNRMLDHTGGDATAVDETLAALNLVAKQESPDLAAALRLAYHRDELTARNTHVPPSLPAVWAALVLQP